MSEINESALKVEKEYKLAIYTCFFVAAARLTFAGIEGMLHYWVCVGLVTSKNFENIFGWHDLYTSFTQEDCLMFQRASRVDVRNASGIFRRRVSTNNHSNKYQ